MRMRRAAGLLFVTAVLGAECSGSDNAKARATAYADAFNLARRVQLCGSRRSLAP